MKSFTIQNAVGDQITLIDQGARVVSWLTNVNGAEREVVVSYPDRDDYYYDKCYLGAIVGPFSNRIDNPQIVIAEQTVKLSTNSATCHVHGGKNALDACVWQVKELSERAITFTYWIEDGFNGYPGPNAFEVEYRLAETSSQLKINFIVNTAKATLLGPSSDIYFNLSDKLETIDNHQLTTEQDLQSQTAKPIGAKKLDSDIECVTEDEVHAVLTSPNGDLRLTVKSDYPTSHIYTGDVFDNSLLPRQGISIAPQFVYSENLITAANSVFNKRIIYKLDKD